MTILDEVCEGIVDCEHKTAPKSDFGYPSIRTTDITNGRIDFVGANRVSKETYIYWTKRRIPKSGDLILAREAPVGEVGYIPEGETPVLGQRTVLISPDREKVFPRYLHYLLLSPAIQHELEVRSSGSTVHHLNMKDIRALEMPALPPLPEQRQIAAILGALDDKIELNRKMSATLEEMARALYRSWFVDFDPVHAKREGRAPAHMDVKTASLFPDSFGDDGLPEGWEAGTLGDVAANSRKQVKPDVVAPDTPYIGLEHMPKRSIVVSDWAGAAKVGSAKTRMQIGQFLFGKLRPYFHKVGLVPTDGICSTDILVVEAKSDNWREFVLCVVSSDEVVEYANASSTGTRMPRVKWSDLAAFEVVVAQNEVVNEFSAIVRPWHEKILAGIYENQTLAALRDALLPRLMSGELRVGKARQQVEEHV